jgi:hypothetical protein
MQFLSIGIEAATKSQTSNYRVHGWRGPLLTTILACERSSGVARSSLNLHLAGFNSKEDARRVIR